MLGLFVVAAVAAVARWQIKAWRSGHPVPAARPTSDPLAAACRPPVKPPEQEPWLEGDGSAERAWQEHGEEVGRHWLVGPNGWIFWSDVVEQYASQAVGRATLSRAQLSHWVSYYRSLRDGLAAEGIGFYIVITPSTSSVYPEELPRWMSALRGSTTLDQFLSVAGELPVIDLRASLIAAKTPEVHLFSWSNSHWTDSGGYFGWVQIARCVNLMHPGDLPLRVPGVVGHQVVGDYNEWASYGVKSPGADWAVPNFSEPLADVTYTDKDGTTSTVPGTTKIDAAWLPLTTSVAHSWTGKSALIVRDSMGGFISPYWDQAYSPTWQVVHDYSGFASFPKYRELVQQHHPDVVVLQLAERHLINSPPAGAAY